MTVLFIVLALAAFIGILLIRALRFIPKKEALPPPSGAAAPDEQTLGGHLARMIRQRTVSYAEEGLADQAQFAAFRALLHELYPHVFERFDEELIGKNGLLLRLAGQGKGEPSVLMAHYDVVPAQEEDWSVPPFEGRILDGEVWGRGALDTKCTVLGLLEAAEQLAAQGFVPMGDLYLSLGGDEECLGSDTAAIVDALEKRGVRPGFVLDEGGAIVEGAFPGVSQPVAVVGTAEKGSAFIDLIAEGKGGHASAPPARQAVGVLARALDAVSKKPLPFRLSAPAAALFDTLGRHSTLSYRLIFANLFLFSPLLDLICRRTGGEMNALVRTTAALTRLCAADSYNVLPRQARAGLNLRLIPGDSIEGAADSLRRLIADKDVEVSVRRGSEPSAVSSSSGEPWQRLKDSILAVYPEVIVSPYLMVAASDSRHYCRISPYVYRFSGMPLSKEQRGMIHGRDERVPLSLLRDLVRFYTDVMQKC